MTEMDDNRQENEEEISTDEGIQEENPGRGGDAGESDASVEDDAISAALHLNEQLYEDDEDGSGVEEAMQAWAEGGHSAAEFEDENEVQLIRFPQLEPGVPQVKSRSSRLDNVVVEVAVELGRKEMTVRELTKLQMQDVIELDKLAGEAFDIRVNGRKFGLGEVVVVTDLMAIRITTLLNADVLPDAGNEE